MMSPLLGPMSGEPARWIGPLLPALHALRPRQWTKNLIVFAAPLFGFSLDAPVLGRAFAAFALFCALSSGFYLLNDILDRETDRRHPVKRHRPIAAGTVPVPVAWSLAASLVLGSLALGFAMSAGVGALLSLYALLQVAYNAKLKHVVLVDIIVISTGFVVRAVTGAVATGIELSVWFLVCTEMLALFLAIEKRKAELRRGGETRGVLRVYSPALLLRMENVATTGTLMSYALWCAGLGLEGATTPWMALTLPLVIYGVFRYQLLGDPGTVPDALDPIRGRRPHAGADETERPEEILLTDRPLLIAIVCWAAMAFAVLWLESRGLIR